MRLSPPLFLLLAGLVSGCAGEPFVDQGVTVSIQKTPNPILKGGTLDVCHSDSTPQAEITALADEQCATHGLKAVLVHRNRWQCRATSPHVSTFRCYDPDLRAADGTYLNPFNQNQVAEWEKRTGKKAPAYGVTRGPVVSPPSPPAETPLPAIEGAPPPPPPAPISVAPTSSTAPLTADDIAGKPAIPVQPVRMTPPPQPVAPPTESDFKLPVGSWGDHFQD